MRPQILVLLASIVLAGCQYAPLDYQQNRPRVQDAKANHDIVLFGRTWHYYDYDGGGEFCRFEYDIEGYRDAERAESCAFCDVVYTLIMTQTEDSSCDFAGPGGMSIGLSSMDRYPSDQLGNFSDWVMSPETGADGFLSATWGPRGNTTDFRVALALFEHPDGLNGDFVEEWAANAGVYAWGDTPSQGIRANWEIEFGILE